MGCSSPFSPGVALTKPTAPGALSSETMSRPGAATETQGPWMENGDAAPSGSTEATDNTYSLNHAGLATVFTAFHPAPSFWTVQGPFCWRLPAAATTTTLRSKANF